MVCGVAFDPDPYCAHHPHEQSTLSSEPWQRRFDAHHADGDGRGDLPAVFTAGRLPGIGGLAEEFLAVDGGNACGVCDAHAQCQNLVYQALRSRLMRSLLNALQDGRLIELPDTDKWNSLKYLAHLIEAIPEIGGSVDL